MSSGSRLNQFHSVLPELLPSPGSLSLVEHGGGTFPQDFNPISPFHCSERRRRDAAAFIEPTQMKLIVALTLNELPQLSVGKRVAHQLVEYVIRYDIKTFIQFWPFRPCDGIAEEQAIRGQILEGTFRPGESVTEMGLGRIAESAGLRSGRRSGSWSWKDWLS